MVRFPVESYFQSSRNYGVKLALLQFNYNFLFPGTDVLPDMTFLLGLSGWTEQAWTGAGSFDLLSDGSSPSDELVEQVHQMFPVLMIPPGMGDEDVDGLRFYHGIPCPTEAPA